MDFHTTDHVYKCIPPVLGIAAEYEEYLKALKAWENDERVLDDDDREACRPAEVKPVVIGLKCIPMPEVDEDVFKEAKTRSEKSAEESQRLIAGFTKERIKSKVAFFENLILDGEEIKDFDTFYDKAPPELVSWVCKAVYSSYILSRAERKN